MQQRHLNRQIYFNELADTTREFYIPYLRRFCEITAQCRVLEIGCGEGGNLLPFAEIGCRVTGIDCAATRITQAGVFFEKAKCKARLVAIDFFDFVKVEQDKYDIVLVHDVIEHIERDKKKDFVAEIKNILAMDGIIFWGFPAWQMPFGGHQQICRSKICSKLPYIHLLPRKLYKFMLKMFGEDNSCVSELVHIKSCRISIEAFEKITRDNAYCIVNRLLWFINPHYKQKFNLKPRKLNKTLAKIGYLRNFLSSSCFYITRNIESQ